MLYNPLNEFFKNPVGSAKEDTEITFKVKSSSPCCELLMKKDGENEYERKNMAKIGEFFSIKISLGVGLYWYCFSVYDNLFIVPDDNLTGVISNEDKCFQLSVYSKNYKIPEWNYGGIIYQIFPDRFNRAGEINKDIFPVFHENTNDTPIYKPNEHGEVLNNDFFGGNIKGIIEKLPYLKSLGVSAIYLNPIFKAYSNHRYDTEDYFKIDNRLGTEEDFDELIKKANSLNVKIILDGVFNHCGSRSVYFDIEKKYGDLGAYHNKNSKYKKWFNFIKYPKVYDSWWGIKTLPSFNKNSKDYVSFITGENGVLDYWTKKGIGGWRLDVVDELPENVVVNLRKRVKSINQNAYVIGEVWEDASNKIAYGKRRKYFLGKELDSVMNYPLKDAIISSVKIGDFSELIKTVKEQIDHYSSDVLNALMNVLSTHDTVRLLTALHGEELGSKTKEETENLKILPSEIDTAIKKLKVATALQYFLYGIPSVYYGDEVGMQGYKDPLNRRFFPWGNENSEILNWFIKLGEIRRKYSAFKKGELKEVYFDKNVFAFFRQDENSEIFIAVNLSSIAYTFSFDGELLDLISEKKFKNKIELEKYGIIVAVAE